MTARIISIISGNFTICDLDNDKIYISKPRGVLKYHGKDLKVGDIISYFLTEDDKAIIEKVMPRTNDLIRPLIANIDQAFLVFSVKEPDLNLNLLDKFLVTLEFNNIKPIIIFNKWDLLSAIEEDNVNKIVNYYNHIGYKTIKTSALKKIVPEVVELLSGKVSVITGQTGVGKSSLLNALDDTLNLETNEISFSLNRGKHTTRYTKLYPLFGGLVADTPGFGSLDFDGFDELSLSHNFIEFFEYSKYCKYNGCLHEHEPNCKVKDALNDGEILKSRYENYILFLHEIRENKKK